MWEWTEAKGSSGFLGMPWVQHEEGYRGVWSRPSISFASQSGAKLDEERITRRSTKTGPKFSVKRGRRSTD